MKDLDLMSILTGAVIGFLLTWLWAWSYISFVGTKQHEDFSASKFCISKNQNLVLYKGNSYYCDGGAIFTPVDND